MEEGDARSESVLQALTDCRTLKYDDVTAGQRLQVKHLIKEEETDLTGFQKLSPSI